MDLQEAINSPNINAFEIIPKGKGYYVHTYRKPGETEYQFQERHQKNLLKANQLKNKAL